MTIFENVAKFKIRLFTDQIGIHDWSLVEWSLKKTFSIERMNRYKSLKFIYNAQKEIEEARKKLVRDRKFAKERRKELALESQNANVR